MHVGDQRWTCMSRINGGRAYICEDPQWPRMDVGNQRWLHLGINGCHKCMMGIKDGRTCLQFNGGCKHKLYFQHYSLKARVSGQAFHWEIPLLSP